MDEKLQIKIETVKSWFVLAQICIILAGFLFAASSVAFTNAQGNLANAIKLYSDNVNFLDSNLNRFPELIEKANLTNEYMSHIINVGNMLDLSQKTFEGLSVKNKEHANIYLWVGVAFTIFSIFFFFYGRCRIQKLEIA